MKRASILALVLAFAMLLTANVAFAATDNYAVSVPKVQNDSDDVHLGNLTIREDEDSDGVFAPGQRITITLPEGVEYETAPTVDTSVYHTSTDYFVSENGPDWKIVAAADNFITVEAGPYTNVDTTEAKLTFTFNVDGTSAVEIDSDVTGDIKVEIDAAGTPITSEYVTVARIVGGDTTTTISEVEDIALDTTGSIGTIKIEENAAGVLDPAGDYIKLVLPNDVKWDYDTVTVIASGVSATKVDGNGSEDNDDKTLYIDVTDASSGQPGFITVTGDIIVDDDADEGEVEMTVKGNEVTEEDVVIANIGDFGFEVEVEGDIETIVAGKEDQDVADIIIDETVALSWIEDRKVTLELPSWAEWNTPDNDSPLENGKIDSDDPEILKYDVEANPSGKAELKDLTVNIDADAPAGDLTCKIYGSAGVEAEVVIAKIVPPFTVEAEKPEFTIGVQNQLVGDITITESEDEALDEGKWVVLKAPYGLTFDDDYEIDVVDGDIEIDNDEVDGRYLAFEITGESGKEPGVIKISNLRFDVDRTVPVGDVVVDVKLTKNNVTVTDFDDAIDDDNYEDVTEVAVAEVVTPAPDEQGNSAQFTIGSTIYNVNGTVKAMDVAPYVKDGRTYTPVRYVAEAIGVDAVDYDAATKTVTLTKGEDVVTLVIGSSIITVNGEASQMDVAAEVNNGRTMLPARFVAEAFGYTVGFDPATKAVVLSK